MPLFASQGPGALGAPGERHLPRGVAACAGGWGRVLRALHPGVDGAQQGIPGDCCLLTGPAVLVCNLVRGLAC